MKVANQVEQRQAAHTPGPWSYARDDISSAGESLYLVGNGSEIVCSGAMEGNARLIAMTPQLLEALTRLVAIGPLVVVRSSHDSDYAAVSQLLEYNEAMKNARAAIAAATGATA